MALAHARSPNARRLVRATGRAMVLSYGLTVYVAFLAVFLYTIGFIGGFAVPKDIDGGLAGSVGLALGINGAILGLFAIQHTIMARPAFKRWWTQYIPPAIERSTFVAITCAILVLLFWQWRPMPQVIWQVEGVGAVALHALFALGFAVVLVSTFLIDHFDLFGVKQVLSHAVGREIPSAQFKERGFYKYVRHPLMLGFLIAFWATPTMTTGHLFFAVMTTGYILLALIIEERTLVALHGEAYEDYRRRVPKIIPGLNKG